MVLGLDFISNVKMNVADKSQSNPSVTYPFQPRSTYLPQKPPPLAKTNIQEIKKTPCQTLLLISSIPPPILTLEPARMKVKTI